MREAAASRILIQGGVGNVGSRARLKSLNLWKNIYNSKSVITHRVCVPPNCFSLT
jgi:hypothetical protein